MKCDFDETRVVPGEIGIITLSHGPLAAAILKTVGMLSMGPVSSSASFCLDDGDILDDYREAFVKAIRAFQGNCLIFVDIFGGTPSNQLLIASQTYPDLTDICAIAGMNVGMVLDAVLLRRGAERHDLMRDILADSKMSIVNMTEAISQLED
jgi:PTS system mannose-specific IIA component